MADNAVPKKKSRVKWFVLLLLLLLVGGGAAGAWFFFLKDKFMPAQDDASSTGKVVVPSGAPPVGTTVPLPVFTTNLADPLGQRFIRLNLEIEAADAKVVDELARQNAKVRNSILLLISSKTYADIATTESKLLLQGEIANRLNNILGPGKIYQVFITDIVIQ
jgi:flagellar FliL protein